MSGRKGCSPDSGLEEGVCAQLGRMSLGPGEGPSGVGVQGSEKGVLLAGTGVLGAR